MVATWITSFFVASLTVVSSAKAEPAMSSGRSATIAAVIEADAQLQAVPFSEIVFSATGKRVLPFDPANAPERALLLKLDGALERVLCELNATNHPAHAERRINEVSAHFEKAICAALNAVPGFACDFPKTATGRSQRSGYPDLRLVDKTTGRVVYLDPKLFEHSSRGSTLRTFYYEPNRATNKVLDDAHHLLIGFEHSGKTDGHWQFLGWELVDLSRVRVRLKAEFQGNNRDLYRPEAIVGRSRK